MHHPTPCGALIGISTTIFSAQEKIQGFFQFPRRQKLLALSEKSLSCASVAYAHSSSIWLDRHNVARQVGFRSAVNGKDTLPPQGGLRPRSLPSEASLP